MSRSEREIAKLKKENQDLQMAYDYLKVREASLQRIFLYMLSKLKNKVVIKHHKLAEVSGKIMANVDEKKGITTFYVEALTEEDMQKEQPTGEGESVADNVLRFPNIGEQGSDPGGVPDMS